MKKIKYRKICKLNWKNKRNKKSKDSKRRKLKNKEFLSSRSSN